MYTLIINDTARNAEILKMMQVIPTGIITSLAGSNES